MIFQPIVGGGGGNAKIERVVWTGNGTIGKENPIVITFSFAPSIVYLSTPSGTQFTNFNGVTDNKTVWLYFMQNIGVGAPNGYYIGRFDGKDAVYGQRAFRSADGKTLTWWIENDTDGDDGLNELARSTMQANMNGVEYTYIAIG